jgi:hypothetical protein
MSSALLLSAFLKFLNKNIFAQNLAFLMLALALLPRKLPSHFLTFSTF